jgi:hypothetical protein
METRDGGGNCCVDPGHLQPPPGDGDGRLLHSGTYGRADPVGRRPPVFGEHFPEPPASVHGGDSLAVHRQLR